MIHRHIKGGLSKHEVQHQQLSPDEEHALAKWIQCLLATGYAVYHSFLHALVEEIPKLRVTAND